jgi:hypothetical protein
MLQNKDAGYAENQQQNIADAIDLLPRLATGIDVNIKFRRSDFYSPSSLLLSFSLCSFDQNFNSTCRIGDFEFTRECAIFDLLDIPLYHGWIVDPQVCTFLALEILCMSYLETAILMA